MSITISKNGLAISGTKIFRCGIFAFDSPAEGIVAQNETRVTFKSSTVGDVDGIDLFLRSANEGTIYFNSPIGKVKVDLKELGKDAGERGFGGLDLRVLVQRYPEHLEDCSLSLEKKILPPKEKAAAYLVKATQEDGQTV